LSFVLLLLNRTTGAKTFGVFFDWHLESGEAAAWNDGRPWSATASCHDFNVTTFAVVVYYVTHCSRYAEAVLIGLDLIAGLVDARWIDRAALGR
jgi:hypothetical protein